jgi:hypothetical protein
MGIRAPDSLMNGSLFPQSEGFSLAYVYDSVHATPRPLKTGTANGVAAQKR